MKKLFNYFQDWFPVLVIGAFLVEVYFSWGDSRQVLFAIIGAIGWLSYVQMRSDYDDLAETIAETKDV